MLPQYRHCIIIFMFPLANTYEILNSFVIAECFKSKSHSALRIGTVASNSPSLVGNQSLNFSDDFYLLSLPAGMSKHDPAN